MVPRLSYLVCATPRSGTGLLTGLLSSTGVAGRPEEYFWEQALTEQYLAEVLERGTTPNGVFGATVILGGGFRDLLRALNRAGTDLEGFFPDLRFVWLRREDTVAQAVSHLRAIQTGVWYAGDERKLGGEPRFDVDALDQLAAEIAQDNRAWGSWFARQGTHPLGLTYEAVAAEPMRAAAAVLDFLGLPSDVTIETRTARQADELNSDWIARYRALRR